MLQAIALRALRAGGQRSIDFTADVEWVGLRVLTPASVLVVAFGLALVHEGHFDLSTLWISAGLVIFVLSAATGAGFLGPETGRISRIAEERGADDPAVQRRIRRVVLTSRIELVLLVLVIFVMVVKPT